MRCPRCDNSTSEVRHTYSKRHPEMIYRRRRCLSPDCRATWRTWERIDGRDPCMGRRPGEPRVTPNPLDAETAASLVVEIPELATLEGETAGDLPPTPQDGANWIVPSPDDLGPTPEEYGGWLKGFTEGIRSIAEDLERAGRLPVRSGRTEDGPADDPPVVEIPDLDVLD